MTGLTDRARPEQFGLVITPAYPSDLDTLSALFERSSVESRRERFHGTVRHIPAEYLHDVVCGAPGVIARVIRDFDRDPSGQWVIALATAILESPDRAEIAVWVDDRWQRRGLGMQLLRAVLDQLGADGVREVVAYLEPDNAAANALARSLARQLDVPLPAGPVVTFELAHTRSEVPA
jgi:RimJ/RimL family protein N-acetyltransferase